MHHASTNSAFCQLGKSSSSISLLSCLMRSFLLFSCPSEFHRDSRSGKTDFSSSRRKFGRRCERVRREMRVFIVSLPQTTHSILKFPALSSREILQSSNELHRKIEKGLRRGKSSLTRKFLPSIHPSIHPLQISITHAFLISLLLSRQCHKRKVSDISTEQSTKSDGMLY